MNVRDASAPDVTLKMEVTNAIAPRLVVTLARHETAVARSVCDQGKDTHALESP